MNDYLFLMHDDAPPGSDAAWEHYLETLKVSGHFAGGSAIGAGRCFSKAAHQKATSPISGYVRVRAESLQDAALLLRDHPLFESGGTVEIRELPRD